jgi:hypothetical protein
MAKSGFSSVESPFSDRHLMQDEIHNLWLKGLTARAALHHPPNRPSETLFREGRYTQVPTEQPFPA